MTSAEAASGGGDEGMARAGATAAARRRELGISQRSLAADGIITAAALIAFEKGRSWPRPRTREKLEAVLGWPPGAIERLRDGEPAAEEADAAPREDVRDLELVVDALSTAAHSLTSVVEALPPVDAPEFGPQVEVVLADLRRLESVATRAARMRSVTPALIKALAQMRRQYDGVMQLAASVPGATLGQRFYAARRRARLSVAEAAHAAGVADEVVIGVESEHPVTPTEAAALEAAIEQLSWD